MKFGIVGNLEKERLPFVVGELLKRVHLGSVEFLMADTLAKAVKSGLKKEIAGRAKIVPESLPLLKSGKLGERQHLESLLKQLGYNLVDQKFNDPIWRALNKK